MVVKSEWSNTSTSPLHHLIQEELYLYHYQEWSVEGKLQGMFKTDEQTMLHRHLKAT
jgi:hypothetical protein